METGRTILAAALRMERTLGLIRETEACVEAARQQVQESRARREGRSGADQAGGADSGTAPDRARPDPQRAHVEALLQRASQTGDLGKRSALIAEAVRLHMLGNSGLGEADETEGLSADP